MSKNQLFKKVRFSKESSIRKTGKYAHNAILPEAAVTAALIVKADKLNKMSVSEISEMFPYSEAMKMKFLEVSAEYPSFEDAIESDFKAKRSIQVNLI